MTDAHTPAARAGRPECWEQCLRLAPLTAARLRETKSCGAARVLSAAPALATSCSAEPWLAVGDAACTFDPVSGTGLCFALRSALEAARVLEQARRGEPRALGRYRAGARAVYEAHLAERAQIYRTETRFGDAPFWSARVS
jgi:2-polyprenyl-6-methoxyphenol hydroxylase-like FAD-dependent oxidoreductase